MKHRILLPLLFPVAVFLFPLLLGAEAEIKLRNIENLNTVSDEFSPSVTEDGRLMVFNSQQPGQRYQDIFYAEYRDGRWSKAEPLAVLNSPYNDETPFISADGSTIIFASDRDGSLEKRDDQGKIKVSFDLYWSQRQGQGFSPPQKVPGSINSAEHERSPTVQKSSGKMFFSRWPFGSFKQARLMVASFTREGFTGLEELKLPLEQGEQLHALIPADNNQFYFTAKRKGGLGGWDIYQGKLDGLAFKDVINLGPEINTSSDEMYFSIVNKKIFLCSNRPGGRGRMDIYSFEKPGPEELLRSGVFVSRDIHFEFDQSDIKPESSSFLGELAEYLSRHKNLRLRIIGHTDVTGRPEYNRELSFKRARAVQDFLKLRGIDPGRIEVAGEGEEKPLMAGSSPQANKLNRRTEFVVIK